MNGIEDRITRKIYIAIGLVLCFTAIIMYRIQNVANEDNNVLSSKYVEGYGDETHYVSAQTVSGDIYEEVNPKEVVNVEVEKIVIEDYTDDTYWNVLLVNKKEKIDANKQVKLGTLLNGKQLDARVIDITNQMIKDAQTDGVSLIVCSGYRSYSYQTGLFNREVNEWKAKGYTQENAEQFASQEVAIPGTSEHQLGLAIDFITKGYTSLDQGFENTDAFKWLCEHAEDYGWILRYNKGKENLTGINYEPWHWRYLGPELAKKVNESGLCYEEFLGRDYTF